MNGNMIECPLCGHRYNSQEHIACEGCPLNRTCQVSCCPNCGYETVDPQKSSLARLAARWLPLRKNSQPEKK
jgi:hypothetical protein